MLGVYLNFVFSLLLRVGSGLPKSVPTLRSRRWVLTKPDIDVEIRIEIRLRKKFTSFKYLVFKKLVFKYFLNLKIKFPPLDYIKFKI